VTLAYRRDSCTPVWSRSTAAAAWDAAGRPSRGVIQVCRASACSVFKFEVLYGASCGD
jgi:hypothetical protein